MDPQRQIIHPKFREVRGQGVYYYDFNPDVTNNLIYAPAISVDTGTTRTVDSNVSVQNIGLSEDVEINEIWFGARDQQLSTLASMFRVFYEYWTTLPDPGDAISWWPADITTDRYDVQITDLRLGNGIEYKEVYEKVGETAGAYVDAQLQLTLKILKKTPIPKNSVTLTGL